MAKALTEIRSIARSHTRTAINVLVGIMRSKDATAAARVSAANAILDRGWGKSAQPHESGKEGALEVVHRIERLIVHPDPVQVEVARTCVDGNWIASSEGSSMASDPTELD